MGKIKKKEKDFGGQMLETCYDDNMTQLNLELKKICLGGNFSFYVIDFQNWTGKGKHLFRLHIKEALSLKSMIDELVYDALSGDANGKR
jgi:hypothetical protein